MFQKFDWLIDWLIGCSSVLAFVCVFVCLCVCVCVHLCVLNILFINCWCSIFLDENTVVCQAGECKNGGTCNVVGDATRCSCTKGYRGAECEGIILNIAYWLLKKTTKDITNCISL